MSNQYSESSRALEWIGSLAQPSLLISAYDIFHGYYDNPKVHLKNAQLVFLDSGGYELAPDFDSTEPRQYPHEVKDFLVEDYIKVLDDLYPQADGAGLVIANYDWDSRNRPLEEQIRKAQNLFNRYPEAVGNFIIKPSSLKGKYLDIPEIVRHVDKLRAFGVIGVTEKELGKNLLDRLKNIAKLRRSLLEQNIFAPIHVWGGLDPIITPLYFFAGAEIFDGVSWLRYSFQHGIAVQRECHSVLSSHGIETHSDHMVYLCMNDNITALQRLATHMMEFVDGGGRSFAAFEETAGVLERAYRTMTTKIPEMKGGH